MEASAHRKATDDSRESASVGADLRSLLGTAVYSPRRSSHVSVFYIFAETATGSAVEAPFKGLIMWIIESLKKNKWERYNDRAYFSLKEAEHDISLLIGIGYKARLVEFVRKDA